MRRSTTLTLIAFGSTALLMACGESKDTPTAAPGVRAVVQSPHAAHMSSATINPTAYTPFTVRAPLSPFKIVQGSDFSIQSNVTSDVVMQQALFAPGSGPWHYHPGPSFIYVLPGQIQLERNIERNVCKKTQVFNPGQAYFEVGNQVHRAIVVSADSAVLLVTRFNIPVGAPFTIAANDPGCV
ncbi:MAG: cupin domain-containing protein [Gemmatimonadaceae bacterium]